ncbi:MAG: radical SAM protein [Nitrospira sp.]|nr:radical SAM protein [Nitrospira sp.]
MLDSLRIAPRPLLNVIQGRPILAVFEVCLRCNSACGYCNLPLNVGRYEMTREEIRRVFTSLYEDGLRFVFVQGGEPLLRRDLPDILEDLIDMGFGLTLITNGTRFTPELVVRLAMLPLNISVSLDTLDRDRYRQIRGNDQLRQVLAGIDLLDGFPGPKYLTCVVSEVNRADVIDVVRFARTYGFMPVVVAYHWRVEQYGKEDLLLQYDRQAASRVFEQVLESGLVPRGYYRNYLRDNVRWLNGGSLERCDAGRYSIAIDASGNVAPCLALTHAGNLLESSLDQILARFDREAIRRCSDHSSCNVMCSRIVGSTLRHPVSALMTPTSVPSQESEAGW